MSTCVSVRQTTSGACCSRRRRSSLPRREVGEAHSRFHVATLTGLAGAKAAEAEGVADDGDGAEGHGQGREGRG